MVLVDKALRNAFRPGKELDDPFLFAGRQEQIIELAQNLQVEGVCPIIYGARGLGKSSLALQVERIAKGDVTLLENYGRRTLALPSEDTYLAYYVRCLDSMPDTRSILQKVINLFSETPMNEPPGPEQLTGRTTTRRFTLKLFQSESQRSYGPADKPTVYAEPSLDEKLVDTATRLSRAHDKPVLVIIDELDLVRDTGGLASFIKNASSLDLKFILVGIGQNVSDLLGDHQSIERIIVPIHLPVMKEPELIQIVDRAMERLADLGLHYAFNRAASLSLARLASGFPWFVHVIGQAALLVAHDANQRVVTANDVETAVTSLASSRFAQQFRDRYYRAVRDSRNRETVLRAFAAWPNQNIPTNEVYPVLRQLGISNPSPYVRELTSERYGLILLRPPYQERGAWRFENEMFKVYVRVSPGIFGVAEPLCRAWHAQFDGTAFADAADPVIRT